jgi:UDP-glucose 4-epimerase
MEEQKVSGKINRVAVTGAAGFIGSHTCEGLLDAGKTVIGIDNLSTGKRINIKGIGRHERFSFFQADICQEDAMAAILGDFQPDAVIHLAALVSVPIAENDPDENYRINVLGTKIVAQAALRASARRMVFASSAAVYGNSDQLPLSEEGPTQPINQYGMAKLEAETLLLSYNKNPDMTPTCLRFFNVYGPRQDPTSPYSGVISIFADLCASGRPVTVYGDGRQDRDFIFIKDITRGIITSATNPELPGGIYNLCTGQGKTLLELLDALKEIYPGMQPPVFKGERVGDIRHSLGNPSAARRILGFEATTSLAAGIHELQNEEK